MAEYIERETAVLQLLEKGQASRRYKLGDVWELNFDEIREAIASIPAADVQPKRYAQKVKFFNDPWTGRMFTTCTACDGKVGQHDKFCKHCGAKFEVGE